VDYFLDEMDIQWVGACRVYTSEQERDRNDPFESYKIEQNTKVSTSLPIPTVGKSKIHTQIHAKIHAGLYPIV